MKHSICQKLSLCLLTICSLFLLFGCGDGKDTEVPAIKPIEITISIDFPAKADLPDLINAPFRAEEDSSVLQLVELFGTVNDIPILVDTTHSTLEGIDQVINRVTYPTGHWIYKVNGEKVNKEINRKIIKDGDILEFIYVKEPR